jgi:hypothetical protein
MNRSTFAKLLERDGHKCLHCGTTEGLVPQHRKNRGMGGSKLRDVPSNQIVLCSGFNGLIEADATAASVAIAYGWKVEGLDAWELIPVYDVTAQGWFVLDDQYNRLAVTSGDYQNG